MKTLKTRICLFLILALMVSVVLPVAASAAIISDHPLSESERRALAQQPTPYVYTPCTGGNGICQLYPKGWAYTYDEDGNIVDSLTKAWQCKNCYTVMITNGDPKAGTIIGDYVIVPTNYDLGNSIIQYVYINSADIRYCGSMHLEGYQFQTNT